jgi:hypothetical protein
MSTAFAITPALTEIALDKDGRGEIAFTVTNRRPAPILARARAVTEAPADASWFTVADPERRFAAGETHTIAVQVTAPLGAPGGRVRMRLDMASVDNPDDDFAEGPWVAVQVPAPAPPPPEKRLPMRLIAVIAAIVLLVAIGVAFAVGGGEDAVAPPDDPPPGTPPAGQPSGTPPSFQGARCGSQADCAAGERCFARRCIKVAPR